MNTPPAIPDIYKRKIKLKIEYSTSYPLSLQVTDQAKKLSTPLAISYIYKDNNGTKMAYSTCYTVSLQELDQAKIVYSSF